MARAAWGRAEDGVERAGGVAEDREALQVRGMRSKWRLRSAGDPDAVRAHAQAGHGRFIQDLDVGERAHALSNVVLEERAAALEQRDAARELRLPDAAMVPGDLLAEVSQEGAAGRHRLHDARALPGRGR
ncbi:hypothetical protein WME89_02295 [Sorangium sp. So ce321]|uniref:hypothetical protein n=1 Tax=Sorangium sp. So ce321 TaxID=3133300 RepID=UPI003F5DC3EE